ncbi:ATP-binding cassette domain-containing protein [Plasticicumulans acidivorans]|uniref:Branched-chain amino acid transport system ATP-binding protein n=1 Tax=Plasticicumulans acidivorans TaxID=886464 RepID=A0A317MV05_9GAMM|nr:ATP-binding cassette domain-containing protein [Plasticicumulans acidivorans]PWV61217.1 branched-chain amino acid transport system ATP-binding protein [Plasticicumulans acidivorans]
MAEALRIIRNEHASIERVLSLLEHLCERIAAGAAPEPALFAAVFDYMNTFADRLHHPKEDDFLFARLRQRDPAAAALIERLEQDHRHGRRALAELQQRLQAALAGGAAERSALLAALGSYVQRNREHMQREERELMPLAEQRLSTIDWAQIDAAFTDHDDPLFGPQLRAEYRALHARLTQLAPQPWGLGGHGTPPEPLRLPLPLLQISGLHSHYGRIEALRGVELSIRPGQLVALVGANGAGKTTLMRCIAGLQPVSAGSIRFDGQDITRLPAHRRVALGIAQSPEGRQVFGPLSIEDNLRLGAWSRSGDGIAEDLERVYARFPVLKDKRRLPAGTLSGGQQQMLAIGRALMSRPRLLLLDEPSMGLAPLLIEEIFAVVEELRAQGMTIFLVEQNASAALAIADIGYVIETGEIVLSDHGPRLLENERVRAAYLGM